MGLFQARRPRNHIPVDESDPGPPTLRHKSAEEAERIQRERAEKISVPPPQPASAPPAPGEVVETFEIKTGPPPPDPLIEKARAQADTFTANLPNFICRQMVTRFESNEKPANWVALDLVEAEVAYEDGIESYQAIKVNGKLLKKQAMSALDSGSWSMGEFGNRLTEHLRAVDPDGIQVPQVGNDEPNQEQGLLVSRRTIALRTGKRAWPPFPTCPEYRGAIWVDEETSRVHRIEMEAVNLPISFPLDTLEMNIDYGMVRIAGQEYLLPVHSETLACMRGELRCSWNKIDFRNYRRFSAESTLFQTESEITFDDKEAPPESEPKPEEK